VLPAVVSHVFAEFLLEVVTSRSVWSVRCHGDLVLVTGAEAGFFPLWPNAESAGYFAREQWPGLEPTRLALERVTNEHLPMLALSRIPVALGVAPHPEAVVVEADRLRQSLLFAERELERLVRERSPRRAPGRW
jgi:hypothetical protein